MSLFRTARRTRSTRPGRTHRALARALATAPTRASRDELVALTTRL